MWSLQAGMATGLWGYRETRIDFASLQASSNFFVACSIFVIISQAAGQILSTSGNGLVTGVLLITARHI